MPFVNWHIFTVCVCVHAPSDFLPFKVSRALPHEASAITVAYVLYSCTSSLRILEHLWEVGSAGIRYVPFQTRKLKGQRERRRPQCSFSVSHSTLPGCLFCIPWHFVKGTKRSSLVNPTKKNPWVLKYTFKDEGELLDLLNSFGRSHSGDSLAVLENSIFYF